MNTLKWLFVFMLLVMNISLVSAASPEGTWITVDDKTGEKKAIVKLVINGDTLTGSVVSAYPASKKVGICSNCPNDFKDKPIVGLQFLWGLQDRGHGVWDGGQILDVNTGKIYRVKLQVKREKLYVRGYIGIAMLGRTQVWVR